MMCRGHQKLVGLPLKGPALESGILPRYFPMRDCNFSAHHDQRSALHGWLGIFAGECNWSMLTQLQIWRT